MASGGGDDVAFLWRVGDGDSHRQLQGTELYVLRLIGLAIVLILLTLFGCVSSSVLVLEGTHRIVLLLFW